MENLKIANGEWIVVCDGRKAIILENAGDEKFPNFKTKEEYEQKSPPTREQGADHPGRSFNSMSPRSSMDQTDWHDQAEQQFLNELAGRLHAAVMTGKPKSLILVAPPRALGMIRHAYSPKLRDAIRKEVHKDLVKLPVYEIEKHLAGKPA